MRLPLLCVALALGTGCGGVDPQQAEPEPAPSNPVGGGAAGFSPTEPEPGASTPEPETGEPTEPEPTAAPAPYLPLAEGTRWTYDVTKDGRVTRKVTTVGALEAVGGTGPNAGTLAFRVVTQKDGSDETVSWQIRDGELAIRYREQAYGAGGLEIEEHWAPFKLRLDESARGLTVGGSWEETYEETKLEVNSPLITAMRTDTWTVMSESESVTVPAGTFDCLRVRKVSSSSTKEYWFARGVGKVMEVGGQTEELVSYEQP